jgi:hypothetical protein
VLPLGQAIGRACMALRSSIKPPRLGHAAGGAAMLQCPRTRRRAGSGGVGPYGDDGGVRRGQAAVGEQAPAV